MIAFKTRPKPVKQLLDRFRDESRSRGVRTITDFALDEIRLPNGPHEGERFTFEHQPSSRQILTALDNPHYWRKFITGPKQYGKTLTGFAIPSIYWPFERGVSAILGVPSMDIVKDKWEEDLLPVIERTRYREFLPLKGGGSRGGTPTAIRFRNGVTLRFMTGGGGDKSRAAFTAPVLIVTETDGFQEIGSKSNEGDKLSQLEGRTMAYEAAGRRWHLFECTVSTEDGRTWSEITKGTDSRLALCCPICNKYVTPDREHLKGWDAAETELAAMANAALVCPKCGKAWDESQRAEANRQSVLIHRGQEVDADGVVTGEPPETNTLGLRISAVNNLFVTVAATGAQEWKVRQSGDYFEERDLLQSFWALPQINPEEGELLTAPAIARRLNGLDPRVCPEWTELITVGTDARKTQLHWSAWAFGDGRAACVDYGVRTVSDYATLGVEAALKAELERLDDDLNDPSNPFVRHGTGEEIRIQDGHMGVDTGNWTAALNEWCLNSGGRWRAVQGLPIYKPVKRRTKDQRPAFEGMQSRALVGRKPIWVLALNTGYYKMAIHEAYRVALFESGDKRDIIDPNEQPQGSAVLWGDDPRAHRDPNTDRFADQSVAERYRAEAEGPGKPKGWHRVKGRANHYLDTSVYAWGIAAQEGQHVGDLRESTSNKQAAPATVSLSEFGSQDSAW